MGFDESSLTNFASRSSSKWRRFAPDVLPMHVAEMDFEVAEEIRATLADLVSRSDLGYLGPIPELADAFEGYAKKVWGWEIEKANLKLATDVGVAAVEILRAVAKPGDRVLINSPVYSSFYHWIHEVGLVEYDAPLRLEGKSWRLDLAGIEAAFQAGVKIFMLCSPQNPVGTIHSRAELQAVSDLANQYGVLVISDEIHAPLSFDEFTPYLSVSGAERNGVVITSSSKAWNTAGLKAGFLIFQSSEVGEKLKAIPDAMHWRSSLLGAFAMVSAFRDCGYWIDETNARLKENLQHLRAEVARQLPKAKMFDHAATYLAWIDLTDYGFENPQQEILKHKVAVVPGDDHAPRNEYSKFVRFNFATSKERITEAVSRMRLALEGKQ